MSRQIDCDHAVALYELRDYLDPVLGGAAETVDEEQRFTHAADVIVHRSGAPGLEFRCSRHPRKVSFAVHGDCGDAGPLIPANNERAMSEPA